MTTAELTSAEEMEGEGCPPDLFQRVMNLGTKREGSVLVFASCAALVLHLSFGGVALSTPFEVRAFAQQVKDAAQARLSVLYEIETEEPPPPEPEPEPEPQPEAPPPEVEPAPAPTMPNEAPSEAPAPAAAEAGAVLTADPEPDAPLDLTDQGFISGTGNRFAGGTTAAAGTSTTAVRSAAATAQGQPNAKGTEPGAAPVVNRSRPAGLAGVSSWDCPFPPEADAENINQAVVRLVVIVGPDGRPKSVTVVSDPGNGFGREAKRYAMTKMYEPSLDASGKPISGPTPPFVVRFRR